MKKKILITTAIALALVCSFCLGAGAGASGTSQQITATLEPGVTVTIDGVPQQFFDANGKRVYPISYNGSTYLPMRTICKDVAGYEVSWDQATRTAAIATKSVDGVDLLDTIKAYDLSNVRGTVNRLESYHVMSADKQNGTISGIPVTHWLSCMVNNNASRTERKSALGSFNLQGKYDTLTFKYYATQDAILEVIGDNDTVLFKTEVSKGQVAQEATVDLLKTNQLTFKFTHNTSSYVDMTGFIFDAYLK